MNGTAQAPAARRPSAGLSRHAWPVLLLLIVGGAAAFSTADTAQITVPLATGLLASCAFLWALWSRRYPLVPWFEIGAIYVAVVSLYMAYPLIGYLVLEGKYTPFNDMRLINAKPTTAEVGSIAWLYVSHLVAFAATYLFVRGRTRIPSQSLRRPRLPTFVALVATYVAIEGFLLFLGLFYDTGADSYAGRYLAARQLPLVLAQLLNHLTGIKHVLSVMLMAALFSHYPRSRPIIVGWIVLAGVVSVARLGSRTEFVLLVLTAVMMYHFVVRPLSPRAVITAALAGLAAFIAFGIIRGGALSGGTAAGINPFAYASEFENLFGNAVHLSRARDSIGSLPLAFHLADFAALVPQQLAPFTKIDRADWYVSRFFPDYAAGGGGLTFGSIAEAVLSGGWISAAVRGFALGFCFAKLHRLYVRRADRFWVFVFYIWAATLAYQSFRNSTFYLLVLIAFRFLPALVAVNLLAALLKRGAAPRRQVASGDDGVLSRGTA